MSLRTQQISGKIFLSLVALFTAVTPFLADWNASHIYNSLWPLHAKFHNAQTMAMGVLLGMAALFFLWRVDHGRASLLAAVVFASLYWVSQVFAFLFPGVAWTDPNLLEPGQSLSDFPLQLKGDVVLLPLIGLASWLVLRRGGQNVDPS